LSISFSISTVSNFPLEALHCVAQSRKQHFFIFGQGKKLFHLQYESLHELLIEAVKKVCLMSRYMTR